MTRSFVDMGRKTWKRLKPLTGRQAGYRSGCLNCGPQPITLPQRAILATGFGWVEVTRDGETVWTGDDERVTLRRFERRARRDPRHDWRVSFHGPLSDATYQRQGRSWVLVAKGLGFA